MVDKPDLPYVTHVSGPPNGTHHAIFFHGLGGSIVAHWSINKDAEYWLQWLSEDINNLTIWAVEYHAHRFRYVKDRTSPIKYQSIELIKSLIGTKNLEEGNVALIGYSAGGLLAAGVIEYSGNENLDDDHKWFHARIKRYGSIATPWKGSIFGSIPVLSDFLASKILKSLHFCDQYRKISFEFLKKWASTPNNKKFSIGEGIATLGIFSVVSAKDANIDMYNNFSASKTHLSIIKIRSREAVVYKELRRQLEIFCKLPDPRSPSFDVGKNVSEIDVSKNQVDQSARDALIFRISARVDDEHPDFSASRINSMIPVGRWNELPGLIEIQFEKRNELTTDQLLWFANIAQAVGSSRAQDFVRSAIAKANEDPRIFTQAYIIAVSGGWEASLEVAGWLNEAIRLSGDNGPLQRFEISDIANYRQERFEDQQQLHKQLMVGEIPIFGVVPYISGTHLDLHLRASLFNINQIDGRQRSVVGVRWGGDKPPIVNATKIALDPSALLSLLALGCLPDVIDGAELVIIPHSTLAWLLNEKQQTGFHQPSRIPLANEVRDYLARDILLRVGQSAVVPSRLSQEVGLELAALLVEAAIFNSETVAHRVIRAKPISKIGFFSNDLADIAGYEHLLSSCCDVIRALNACGALSKYEYDQALRYLAIHENVEIAGPPIPVRSCLYLDGLSLYHLQYCGLLGRLRDFGFTTYLSSDAISHQNEISEYGRQGTQIDELIEVARSGLDAGIRHGKITIGHPFVAAAGNGLPHHPTLEVPGLANLVDAVIFDDRFLTKHENVETSTHSTPSYSVYDLLRHQYDRGHLTLDRFQSLISRGRQANLAFNPLEKDELAYQLKRAQVVKGVLEETRELRAIREHLDSLLLDGRLQMPLEAPWLFGAMNSIRQVARDLWADSEDNAECAVKSQWLWRLHDLRRWADYSASADNDDDLFLLYAKTIFLFVLNSGPQDPVSTRYQAWINGTVLPDLEQTWPKVYRALKTFANTLIADRGQDSLLLADDEQGTRQRLDLIASWQLIPEYLRSGLNLTDQFKAEVGVSITHFVTFGTIGLQLDAEHLLTQIRTVLSGNGPVEISDQVTEDVWTCRLGNEAGEAVLERGSVLVQCPYSFTQHPDLAVRLGGLRRVAEDNEFDNELVERWTTILSEGPLDRIRFDEFEPEARNSPARFADVVTHLFQSGPVRLSDLVPDDPRYYERLIGKLKTSTTVDDFIDNELSSKLDQIAGLSEDIALNRALLINGHPAIAALITKRFTDSLGRDGLDPAIDPLSNLAKLEALAHAEQPDFERIVENSNHIRWACLSGGSQGQLMEGLFALIERQLARNGTLAGTPPFWRRLATFAHLALLWRAIPQHVKEGGKLIDNLPRANEFGTLIANMLDLQMEPRWLPSYASADQMNAEMLGRAMIAIHRLTEAFPEKIEVQSELTAYKNALGDGLGVAAFLPGPCEAAKGSSLELSMEDRAQIEVGLNLRPVDQRALQELCRWSLYCGIDEQLMQLAIEAIRHLNRSPDDDNDHVKLNQLLEALAMLAASSRSTDLFYETKILWRKIRINGPLEAGSTVEFQLILMACAAFADEPDYNRELGEWLKETALAALTKDEATGLEASLEFASYLKPRLSSHLQPALAAVRLRAGAPT